MLLLKIFITAAVVLFVTILTEKKGGRIGGIAAGFPSAFAIIMLFLGLDHSHEFLEVALISSLLGFLSLFVFEGIYIVVMKRIPFSRFSAPFLSIVGLFVVNYFLQFWTLLFLESLFLAFISILFAHFLFHWIQPKDEKIIPRKLSPQEIVFRVFLASSIIIAISEATNFLPPQYSGVLAMFPCITLATLLILQRSNTADQLSTFLKHHPLGLIPILGFTTTFFYASSVMNIVFAWFLSFVSAFIILMAQMFVRNALQKKFKILSSFSSSS